MINKLDTRLLANFTGYTTRIMDDLKDLLKSLRTDYNMDILDISSADQDPFMQFAGWMQLAIDKNVMEPNAMTLSTVSDEKRPSSRIVLLRNFNHDGFVFYTNYESHKSRELSQNNQAALNFFWPELHKQVRIEGKAQKIDESESEAYFNSRPRESQLGAWVSEQSKHLQSRKELDEKFENLTKEFEGKTIKRPEHWGGYRVRAELFEFWQGRPNRLHDRIQYQFIKGVWEMQRLYP